VSMRIVIRSEPTARSIHKVVLLGLVMIAVVIPGREAAFSQGTPKFLSVHANGPVEFILTDPQGRRTGFNPTTNTWFQDIPTSDYGTYLTCDEQNFSFCDPPNKQLNMANQMDGQYTLDVIGTGSGDFRVEVTTSDAAGNWISHVFEGTMAPGHISQFNFPGKVIIFAAFAPTLRVNSTSKVYEISGGFTLGPGGIISPETQPVSIGWHNFVWTIPAGSFREAPQGAFVFEGVIKGITLCSKTAFGRSADCLERDVEPDKHFDATLRPTGGNGYAFKIVCTGLNNLPSANPVDIALAVGNNGGSASVNASFLP